MKTVITFMFICFTALGFGQNNTTEDASIITKEKTLELKEVMRELSAKLEALQQDDVLITKVDMKILRLKLAETMVKIENSETFKEFVHITAENGEKVKVAYRFTAIPEDHTKISAIENVNFEVIGDTLSRVLMELQESPKLKDLAARINELEEKLESRQSKN